MIEFSTASDGAHILEVTQLLPAARSKVFDFFSDAFQLELITPPWLHFSVLTPPPIEMQAGALIDYRLRLHGIPMKWRTRIAAWEPEHRFVDEQVQGPYLVWQHEHQFHDHESGTLVFDRVRYSLRFSWLLHRFFVRRDLQRIFEYRREKLYELFSA